MPTHSPEWPDVAVGGYKEFLTAKLKAPVPEGITVALDTPHLFDWQARVTEWALKRGRAAIFADTGLGKTRMLLAWANEIAKATNGNVLVLAPLGVVSQTCDEAASIGIDATPSRDGTVARIAVTNYERLHHYSPDEFVGIVLDESSRIKNFDSKTRDEIITTFDATPYRLACTATPAPNDHMELGNHAEFLGVMTRAQMLAMYFVHDGARTSQWRLKGHAKKDFWRWVSTWAVAMKHPRDLGFDGDGYDLPELDVKEHSIPSEAVDGTLFGLAATLTEQRQARRGSLNDRVTRTAELVADEPHESWVVWCELNDESAALGATIPGAVELSGSDDIDTKEAKLRAFTTGETKVLVTKPSIAGFGMNWQHCARTAFCGIGHSFESYYQAVRRFHRFGQTRPVKVHIVYSEAEMAVMENLRRKESEAQEMTDHMVALMGAYTDLAHHERPTAAYAPGVEMEIPAWLTS